MEDSQGISVGGVRVGGAGTGRGQLVVATGPGGAATGKQDAEEGDCGSQSCAPERPAARRDRTLHAGSTSIEILSDKAGICDRPGWKARGPQDDTIHCPAA